MTKPGDSGYGSDRPMDRLALCLIYMATGMTPENLEDWMTPEQKRDPELMAYVQELKEKRQASRGQASKQSEKDGL